MAVVVSFINFKGEVGKTTLSVEVAASLYKKFNSRVLMIDLDLQSNCFDSEFIGFMGLPLISHTQKSRSKESM